jgi:hypothetical protein
MTKKAKPSSVLDSIQVEIFGFHSSGNFKEYNIKTCQPQRPKFQKHVLSANFEWQQINSPTDSTYVQDRRVNLRIPDHKAEGAAKFELFRNLKVQIYRK